MLSSSDSSIFYFFIVEERGAHEQEAEFLLRTRTLFTHVSYGRRSLLLTTLTTTTPKAPLRAWRLLIKTADYCRCLEKLIHRVAKLL